EAQARERAALEERAIQIRADLGDITGLVAKREKELNAMVAAGALSRADATASLKAYREGLDGTTDEQREWQQLLDRAKSPLDAVVDRTAKRTAGRTTGKVGAVDGAKALAILRAEMARLIAQEELADPRLQAVAAARAKIAQANFEALTVAQKL